MALEAFLLAAVAQPSLLVGGFVVYGYRFSSKVIGWLAAFGAGALIAAVSFDLIPEGAALSTSGVGFCCWPVLRSTSSPTGL